MTLIDSHCHLDFAAFSEDREQVLSNCLAREIKHIVIPGVTANSWLSLMELCNQHIMLHFALGLHPIFLNQHQQSDLDQLDQLLTHQPAIAVGEIGLDFFVKELDKNKQIEFFEAQLLLAKKHNLPVILHTRKSHDQTIALLKKHQVKGGIAHAFNGSIQQAHAYIELGFKLGFGGMLTYQRSTKLRKLAKELPLEAIVLETDSPDMTVEQHRGSRNSPEYLPYILDALSQVRQEDKALIAATTTQNTRNVLGLVNSC